eukprot:scaffold2878_cov111-Isochrysis_galbana.AAC.4
MAPVAVEGWDVAGGEATGGKAADGKTGRPCARAEDKAEDDVTREAGAEDEVATEADGPPKAAGTGDTTGSATAGAVAAGDAAASASAARAWDPWAWEAWTWHAWPAASAAQPSRLRLAGAEAGSATTAAAGMPAPAAAERRGAASPAAAWSAREVHEEEAEEDSNNKRGSRSAPSSPGACVSVQTLQHGGGLPSQASAVGSPSCAATAPFTDPDPPCTTPCTPAPCNPASNSSPRLPASPSSSESVSMSSSPGSSSNIRSSPIGTAMRRPLGSASRTRDSPCSVPGVHGSCSPPPSSESQPSSPLGTQPSPVHSAAPKLAQPLYVPRPEPPAPDSPAAPPSPPELPSAPAPHDVGGPPRAALGRLRRSCDGAPGGEDLDPPVGGSQRLDLLWNLRAVVPRHGHHPRSRPRVAPRAGDQPAFERDSEGGRLVLKHLRHRLGPPARVVARLPRAEEVVLRLEPAVALDRQPERRVACKHLGQPAETRHGSRVNLKRCPPEVCARGHRRHRLGQLKVLHAPHVCELQATQLRNPLEGGRRAEVLAHGATAAGKSAERPGVQAGRHQVHFVRSPPLAGRRHGCAGRDAENSFQFRLAARWRRGVYY